MGCSSPCKAFDDAHQSEELFIDTNKSSESDFSKLCDLLSRFSQEDVRFVYMESGEQFST